MSELETGELGKVSDFFQSCFPEVVLSLEKMFEMKIKLNFDEISIVDLSNWEKITWGLPLHEFWAGYIETEEDINLGVLFLLSGKDAQILCSNLMGQKSMDEKLQKSIILEVTNVASGSLFNSISKKTNYILAPSLPSLAIESAKIVMEKPILRDATNFDSEIVLKSKLVFNDNCQMYFFIFINSQQAKKIIKIQLNNK